MTVLPAAKVACPAGSAILKDIRVWHGGCANGCSPVADPALGYLPPGHSKSAHQLMQNN